MNPGVLAPCCNPLDLTSLLEPGQKRRDFWTLDSGMLYSGESPFTHTWGYFAKYLNIGKCQVLKADVPAPFREPSRQKAHVALT